MQATHIRAGTTASLLVVGVLFGSSFLLVKLLIGEVSPLQITAWRLFFGGAALLVVLALRGETHLPAPAFLAKATVLAMLDSIVPNTLMAWAQIRIDSGIAAVLIASMPLFTVLFAVALPGQERVAPLKVGGVVFGAFGVVVLVGADARSLADGAPTAYLAALGAAMSNAAAVIYARSILAGDDALKLSGVKLVIGAIITLPMTAALYGEDAIPHMGIDSWVALIALGVLVNALGRTMYLSLIASSGSVRASLVAYIVPVVAVLLGWLMLGEQIGAAALAGMTLIVLGVALVTHGRQLARLLASMRHLVASRHIGSVPAMPSAPEARLADLRGGERTAQPSNVVSPTRRAPPAPSG